MTRYIDAEKFKRMYREQLNCVFLALQKSFGEAIDDVPTADVRENVHGEWIFIPIDDSRGRRTGDMGCVCKKCTYEIVLPFGKDQYNFCPNCGADMRKGEAK